jgi:hypothetical protein
LLLVAAAVGGCTRARNTFSPIDASLCVTQRQRVHGREAAS